MDNDLDLNKTVFEEHNRLVIFPIKHKEIWDMYKKQQKCFWTAEEIDFSKDYSDWIKLNDNERYFIKNILGFFAASDSIVNINILNRFIKEINILEAQYCYMWQAAIENIHSEVYSIMIDTLIRDQKEKTFLLNAVNNIPCVNKKANWALKWINNDNATIAMRILAFACVEGIFFSGSFCAIYWLKNRNIMVKGLGSSNDFIARDEGMHYQFATLLYSMLKEKLSFKIVEKIVKEVVEIEIEFITESLPVNLIGMNNNLMIDYIKYVADRLLIDFGYGKIYNSNNPFEFIENISLEAKTNFFENRSTEYKLAEMNTSSFNLIDEF